MGAYAGGWVYNAPQSLLFIAKDILLQRRELTEAMKLRIETAFWERGPEGQLTAVPARGNNSPGFDEPAADLMRGFLEARV